MSYLDFSDVILFQVIAKQVYNFGFNQKEKIVDQPPKKTGHMEILDALNRPHTQTNFMLGNFLSVLCFLSVSPEENHHIDNILRNIIERVSVGIE